MAEPRTLVTCNTHLVCMRFDGLEKHCRRGEEAGASKTDTSIQRWDIDKAPCTYQQCRCGVEGAILGAGSYGSCICSPPATQRQLEQNVRKLAATSKNFLIKSCSRRCVQRMQHNDDKYGEQEVFAGAMPKLQLLKSTLRGGSYHVSLCTICARGGAQGHDDVASLPSHSQPSHGSCSTAAGNMLQHKAHATQRE